MAQAVVVGAGVIGLCVAYSLRARGLDVVVVDSREPGRAASHGNAGWVTPAFSHPVPGPGITASSLRLLLRSDSPLYIKPRLDPRFLRWLWRFWRRCNQPDYDRGVEALARLNLRTLELYDALVRDGVKFEMHQDGLLFLFRDLVAAEGERAHLKQMQRFGYPPARWLDFHDVHQEQAGLAESVVGGLLAPAERHVRPESLTAGLAHTLRERGVTIRGGVTVVDFAWSQGRIWGVRTTEEVIAASTVVLAAGAWTGRLAERAGLRIPLEGGKGYSVTFSTPASVWNRPMYLAEARVGFTPFDGAMRLAGTMELSGINDVMLPRRIQALKDAPSAYLKGWDGANLQEEWNGMRPLTPDGLPIIGALPGAENCILATGHSMLGVTLGPATGEAVADLALGRPDRELLAPFRADRF